MELSPLQYEYVASVAGFSITEEEAKEFLRDLKEYENNLKDDLYDQMD